MTDAHIGHDSKSRFRVRVERILLTGPGLHANAYFFGESIEKKMIPFKVVKNIYIENAYSNVKF